MMRSRRASVIVALYALVSAATAHAECAWMLWTKRAMLPHRDSAPEFALEAAYTRVDDCTKALDQKSPDTRGRATSTVVTVGDQMWVCLPDTVDPRGPEGK